MAGNAARTLALLLLFLLLAAAPVRAQDPGGNAGRIHERALKLLQEKRYEDSIRAYAVLLKARPDDMIALYNVACACSLMGKKDRAVAFLERAMEEGYADYEHLARDPDLDPIREEPGYLSLLSRREEFARRAEEKREASWRARLGSRYSYTRDKDYNILFITNVEDRRRDELLGILRRYSDALWRDCFPNKPAYTITVLVPGTNRDYTRDFGQVRAGAAGYYNHGSRTLTVNLQTGTGTMTHEWTHALHHADQEGLKQSHPIWIVEGFGSLFEGCTVRDDGTAVGLLNWRLRGLQLTLRDRPASYIPFETLMDPKSRVFRKDETIGLAYAEARYIFYYMQEKGILQKFYAEYRRRFAEDPTGAKIMEELLGAPLGEIEEEWKAWVMELRYGMPLPPPQAVPTVRLGVTIQPAQGGGVGVGSVSEESCADKAGIRPGDVIVEADGTPVRLATDLFAALMKKNPGDRMTLKLRRGAETVEVEAVLDAR